MREEERGRKMSDLIDRQATIDAMLKLQAEDDESYGCHIPEGFDGERAKEALEQLPSAKPEIIRCKDCKYYGRADKRRFYRGMDCLNNHIGTIVPDKDFCSRAERREDADHTEA